MEIMEIPEQLKKFIKVKQTVITLDSEQCIIYTYTVIPTNSHGIITKNNFFGLDDNTYKAYPELIDLVPRGLSILVNSNNIEICRLDGLPKFDGSMPLDEDDDIVASLNISIFQKNMQEIKEWSKNNELEVSFNEKANGKLTIFKLFNYKDNLYILGGSKNVHVIQKFPEESVLCDVLHYKMLSIIQNDLNKLSKDNLNLLLNKTVIGEYVDNKHIVYEPTKEPYIVYFSLIDNIPLNHVKELIERQNTVPTEELFKSILVLIVISLLYLNILNIRNIILEVLKGKRKVYIKIILFIYFK